MKLPNQIFGIETDEAYNSYLEESKKSPQPDKPKVVPISGSDRFSLENLVDSWMINGVNYRNGIYQVELGKELLENKAQKTQDEWIKYTKQAIQNNQFYLGDMQLYHSLFEALFRNKDNAQHKDVIEQARVFLQKTFESYWLMTLSRVKYTKQGQDKVTHNYGLQDKLEIQGNIVGADGYITQINPQNELNAILGRDDINEINQVYNWITGKNTYLWRLNSKPKKDDERVVRFYSDSDWSDLVCYRYLDDSGRGLAVRAKKILKG